MRKLVIFISLLLIGVGSFAQSNQVKNSTIQPHKLALDSVKNKSKAIAKKKRLKNKKLIIAADTLTPSDYVMSIDRVNDNLDAIGDSAKLGFEVVHMERRVDYITNNIKQIRQNVRDKSSKVNLKNLYLYQNFAANLDEETDWIQESLGEIYSRVYNAKLRLRNVLSDSIFHKMYVDTILRNIYEDKLASTEEKWAKTDTLTKTNLDSLNVIKVKNADNGLTLGKMMNRMENRLDKIGKQLFKKEVNFLWEKAKKDTTANVSANKALNILDGEQKAIAYYFSQTSDNRAFIFFFGIILFIWLFAKRKTLKLIREQKDSFAFLNLQYLHKHPVLSVFVLLLCLTPFFDAYAPTSYVAIEFLLLLIALSVILYKKGELSFLIYWSVLVILFVTNVLTYLLVDPTFGARIYLLALYIIIIVFSILFYRKLNKQMPYYRWIKTSVIIGIILTVIAIIFNLFGRFSLSGMFGIAGIFAIIQVVALTIFIEIIIEIILLQLQSSRLKKGVDRPFDCSVVINKIKGSLFIVALILWLIMLTTNLDIYHSISNYVVDLFTETQTIGSISFKLISLLMFFVIIWSAHILQRLISFLFGETGSEMDDLSAVSKGQHSRLMITRLLVLIGGYLLAIAASGLPIDKLTFLLGALGVGVGMGLQNIVNNFVSGIILIFDGSLQIGDEIEVSGQSGKVKELGLRASTLKTADGAEVIIPNGNILSQNIVNWTFSSNEKRIIVEFSLSGKELDANMINEVINNTIKDIPNVVAQRKPVILYTKVTQETCSLTVRFWGIINKADSVKSEAMLQLSSAFTAKNIGFG